MREKKRAKPQFRADEPLAMPPKAFGEEFNVLFFGRGATDLFEEIGKYAVVDVCGPLEQHESYFLDSYDEIKGRVAAAFASSQPEVCLRINSPGGSFAGCLELAREIRAMATTAKKPLKAFVDSQALSAGYALAAPCDEIVITPSASVGSVGVWSALVDATAQDAARGLRVEIVASDENKADRNPHAKMTSESIERLRGEVEDMAEMFREEVAEGRAIRPSSLRKLKGAAVFGEQAVKAHLADRLVDSWEKFLRSDSSPVSKANKKEEMNMGLYSKAAMQEAAAKGDEDAKVALALMAKAEDDEDSPEAKKAKKMKAEKEEEDKKEAEDKKAKGKAKEDAPIKKDDEKDAKALALEAIGLVHAMQSEAATKESRAEEAEERKTLLATRPDFTDKVLGLLNAKAEDGSFKLSLDEVKSAVENFPKTSFRNPNANALAAHGTPGSEANVFNPPISSEVQAALDKHMPLGGRTEVPFQVGCGDVDAARKFLALQEKNRLAAPNGKGV